MFAKTQLFSLPVRLKFGFDSKSSRSICNTILNEVGVHMLQPDIAEKLFPGMPELFHDCQRKLEDINTHLSNFGITTSKDRDQGIRKIENLSLPPLKGNNLLDHFWEIAYEQIETYLKHVNILLCDSENIRFPNSWPFVAGWSRQHRNDDKWESVSYPDDGALVFDVEVISSCNLPVLATAISSAYWYVWCSSNLINTDYTRFSPSGLTLNSDDLIQMEDDDCEKRSENRIIIGHNVSFDRSYISNQYDWTNNISGLRFLDTFSMHVACSGFGSNQRQTYQYLNKQKHLGDWDNHGLDNPLQVWANTFALNRHEQTPQLNWMNESSANNLVDVLALYCPEEPALSKEIRSIFVNHNRPDPIDKVFHDIRERYSELCTYCANDVLATLKVARRLYPLFLDRFPNPVTISGILEMSTMLLPVKKNAWKQYIFRSEQIYKDTSRDLHKLLQRHADSTCSYLANEEYAKDPWLRSLDWTTQVIKLKKETGKKKIDDETMNFLGDRILPESDEFKSAQKTEVIREVLATAKRLPKKISRRAGYPKWYRDLCLKKTHFTSSPINSDIPQATMTQLFESEIESPYHGAKLLTIRNNVTPYILKLTWGGYTMCHDRKHGWGFLRTENTSPRNIEPYSVEQSKPSTVEISNRNFSNDELGSHKIIFTDFRNKSSKNKTFKYSDTLPAYSEGPLECVFDKPFPFYKITHPTGKLNANVGNPLSKSFHVHALSGLLDTNDASLNIFTLVKWAQMSSYWENSVARISSQFYISSSENKEWAAIIPRTIVSGTVTRRAVERTWLTASNPTLDRIGSELKSLIQTPESHCFVGADVDSQEMWISALLGDSSIGIHGSTACSWMLLNGNRAEGTDLHSHIASTIGISRDHAKVLNYARIYGAGATYAARLLRAFNPKLSSEDSNKKVNLMYRTTKGIRRSEFIEKNDIEHVNENKIRPWTGGSESGIFNALESIALGDKPCTPVLGARMTRALEPRNVGHDFMTSRVNWVVQSSAVDYLHLILTCMRWLCKKQIQNSNKKNSYFPRLSLSIHDEVRYITLRKDAYHTALNLQIANLMTRSIFAYQLMKFNDKEGKMCLPKHVAPPSSVCFFSSVEIDTCLRKQVDDQCITPSNPLGLTIGYSIPNGESFDIYELLKKCNPDI